MKTIVALAVSLFAWTHLHADAPDDVSAIESLLDRFLAGVSAGDRTVHDWFWSEDLVYTSSSGQRFGKEEIVAPVDSQETVDDTPGPSYSAEAVDVRLYGKTAVLAFQLVAEAPGAEGAAPVTTRYWNTGTLRKTGGNWSVVAWQATRIPEAPSP